MSWATLAGGLRSDGRIKTRMIKRSSAVGHALRQTSLNLENHNSSYFLALHLHFSPWLINKHLNINNTRNWTSGKYIYIVLWAEAFICFQSVLEHRCLNLLLNTDLEEPENATLII